MHHQAALVRADKHELLFAAAYELRDGNPFHLFQRVGQKPIRFFAAFVGCEIVRVIEKDGIEGLQPSSPLHSELLIRNF